MTPVLLNREAGPSAVKRLDDHKAGSSSILVDINSGCHIAVRTSPAINQAARQGPVRIAYYAKISASNANL